MDFNDYVVEQLVKERLREAQRLAALGAWHDRPRAPRRRLRAAMGLAMIRVGRWVLGQPVEGEPAALGR
ncbi:MAG: hypothetical protein HY726_15365 [Candidatus Rokubacteria bacterium]|nr:hypothetical protein [Candidatus Rokubacteria bacterium]